LDYRWKTLEQNNEVGAFRFDRTGSINGTKYFGLPMVIDLVGSPVLYLIYLMVKLTVVFISLEVFCCVRVPSFPSSVNCMTAGYSALAFTVAI
jgi:hypothetical protein